MTVTYKATVANAKRAAQASNTAAISTTFYDGTAASKTTVDSNDTATVSAYDVNIKRPTGTASRHCRAPASRSRTRTPASG